MTQKNLVAEEKDHFSPSTFEGTLAELKARVEEWISEYGEAAYIDWAQITIIRMSTVLLRDIAS